MNDHALSPQDLLQEAANYRADSEDFQDSLTEAIFTEAARIADSVVVFEKERHTFDLEHRLDSILTSRTWGFPIMVLLLGAVLWITMVGANIPSGWLSTLLLGWGFNGLHTLFDSLNSPFWLTGLLVDGVYLATAWVISVMLPPMAIFFPLFTLLEDFGYLPRVAFNLDRAFSKAGGHGKQALTMTMGFGCNAAGVIAARVIESPRDRLIAILTNNFALCNGRWPTQIMLATIFIGALVPAAFSPSAAALAVLGIALLGVLITFGTSWALSRTLLKGQPASFILELPPYRPPRIWQTIATSVIDRTLIVLWRAIVMAAPAGAIIWLLGNLHISGVSLASLLVNALNPLGLFVGLNGIILLAYVAAIPANEIVIPTILTLTLTLGRAAGASAGVMVQMDTAATADVLIGLGGWTLLTGINLMLFSLMHNPCSTTILTIYRETKSLKWTTVATLMPVALGLTTTTLITWTARLIGWA